MTLAAIFSAIAGAIKAVPIIDGWFQMLMVAWMDGQNNVTYAAIADAASLAGSATTDAQRYVASQAWQKALQRPRVTP